VSAPKALKLDNTHCVTTDLPREERSASCTKQLIAMLLLEFSDIFTALHEMQTRSSDENSIRPSVCLSDA